MHSTRVGEACFIHFELLAASAWRTTAYDFNGVSWYVPKAAECLVCLGGILIDEKKFVSADLVLKLLSSDGETAKEAANNIEGMMKDVKEIAANYKKAGVTNADWWEIFFLSADDISISFFVFL